MNLCCLDQKCYSTTRSYTGLITLCFCFSHIAHTDRAWLFSPVHSFRAILYILCSLQLVLVEQQGKESLNRLEAERSRIRNSYVGTFCMTSAVVFWSYHVCTSQKASLWKQHASRQRFQKQLQIICYKTLQICIRITLLSFEKKNYIKILPNIHHGKAIIFPIKTNFYGSLVLWELYSCTVVG